MYTILVLVLFVSIHGYIYLVIIIIDRSVYCMSVADAGGNNANKATVVVVAMCGCAWEVSCGPGWGT